MNDSDQNSCTNAENVKNVKSVEGFEEKLTELQTQLAYQEDTITTLNDTVYQQQKAIDQLNTICNHLVKRVGDMSAQIRKDDNQDHPFNPADELPPHY